MTYISESHAVVDVLNYKIKMFMKYYDEKPNMVIIGEEAFAELKTYEEFLVLCNQIKGRWEFKGIPIYRSSFKDDLFTVRVGIFKEDLG